MKTKIDKKTKKIAKRRPETVSDGNSSVDDDDGEISKKSMFAEHKAALERIRANDPKFYEFLKEEDAELLDFDLSDTEDIDDAEENEKAVQKINYSDEEEIEDDEPEPSESPEQGQKRVRPDAKLKGFIETWCTVDEEDARRSAFQDIGKLVRGSPNRLVPLAVKKMYMAYVKNTRLVTQSTWPLIRFMQESYAEICGLNKQLTYQYAFVYIRQLAIHLRIAITAKKKEQIMAVYNWQFVQCLYLWSRVLSVHAKDDIMKPLIYPLIQVALGCAKLVPTGKYIPLRLHCVRAIMILIQEAQVYAPVLPVVLEVFQLFDCNKKHQRQSLKPFDLDCMLKFSQSQLQESAFKVGVVESTMEVILEIMIAFVGSTAFPELAYVCNSRLKSFCHSCRIASLSQPAKELSKKITEHAEWLEQHRSRTALKLANVSEFETHMVNAKDSPLRKYYDTFTTMKERERRMKLETAADQKEEDSSAEKTKRPVKKRKLKEKPAKTIKNKKARKMASIEDKEDTSNDQDVVQDLNLSDLED